MFEKIRAALDECEYQIKTKHIAPEYLIDTCYENNLVLALYYELNAYTLGRKLKTLTDPDVPDQYKRFILKQLKKEKCLDERIDTK